MEKEGTVKFNNEEVKRIVVINKAKLRDWKQERGLIN